MSESLPLDQFVARQLASGRYQSKEALIEASLRLLQEQEEELDHIADELRPALHDYLGGDRGAELDIEAMKAAGRNRLGQSH